MNRFALIALAMLATDVSARQPRMAQPAPEPEFDLAPATTSISLEEGLNPPPPIPARISAGLSDAEAAAQLTSYDRDKSGALGQGEFISWLTRETEVTSARRPARRGARSRRPAATARSAETNTEMFKRADRDGDKSVSLGEFQAFVLSAQLRYDPDVFDTNGLARFPAARQTPAREKNVGPAKNRAGIRR